MNTGDGSTRLPAGSPNSGGSRGPAVPGDLMTPGDLTAWNSTPVTDQVLLAQDALPMRNEVRLRMKARPASRSVDEGSVDDGRVDGGGVDGGGVDGAWWPRSRQPATEFPELVLVMSSWIGPVRRVTYHLGDWDTAERAVTIEGWHVELVGSATLEPHTVLVAGTHERSRSLLVVPPDVPGGVARAVLKAAAGPDVVADAAEMLTSNGVRLGQGGEVVEQR